MTARLFSPVSAVMTRKSPQSTGEDQPLSTGTFHRVVVSSTATGRPVSGANPVPLGPRKRFQSLAACKEAAA